MVLSFYTVSWHNDNRRLHIKESQTQKQYQKLMATHKQLLTEHSEKVSGKQIKQIAIEKLHMKPPLRTKQPRKGDWREITL